MAQDIAVRNLSSVVTDAELAAALPAFQIQVSRDFAPTWGVDARLRIVAKGEHIADGEWVLGVFDDADQAGALGYHDVTASGAPLGKVFAGTTKKYGGIWTVTFSHELLEMLGDPEINLCALDENAGRLYCREACDAVEADELGYDINGVRVSDFVLPSWFQPSITTSRPRSFCGHVHKAWELAPGGYIGYLDFNSPDGWKQETAQRAPHMRAEAKPHGTSRLPRRAKPGQAHARVHSTAE